MFQSRTGLHPVARAAIWMCVTVGHAVAAEGQLPETHVAARKMAHDALDPSQTPYSTELLLREELERQQVLDIRDATRDMVGVDVPRQPRRGVGISGTTGREGNTGFEIRGLGGNRVQMLVDGIPQPEAESFMNSHSFGRDYVDPLTLSAIEVHKGVSPVDMPAGGIAGAVNLRTLVPTDLLGAQQTLAGRALLGWRSENKGAAAGLALAGKVSEQLQWLLALNGEHSDETETQGSVGGTGLARTQANPQDVRRRSALAKLVWQPSTLQTHVFGAEYRGQDNRVNNLHDFANGTTRSHTDDESSTRERLSLQSDFRLHAPAADLVNTYLAWQNSRSVQTLQLDTSTQGLRVRDHSYRERLLQAGVKARKQLGAHALYYGMNVSSTQGSTQSFSVDRGIATAVPKGPDTRTTRWGVFVHDSMVLGALTLTPALRYESVDMDADTGAVDTAAAGVKVVSKRYSAWMPQLGAQWQLAGSAQVFANYARGFRPPTAGELNNFFGNVTPYYGYYILPNPDLKAETSNHFDLGLRGHGGALQWEAAAFYGRFQNFIERYASTGTMGTRPVITLQQSRNQASATLKGVELKGRAQLGRSWGGAWTLRGSYGYTKGTGEDGQGLESISPHQLKLGLGQNAARWSWELTATHVGSKRKSDLPAQTPSLFMPPSHTVLDLNAQLELRHGMRLNLGLLNLTNRKYWNWSDVRGVTQTAELAAIDAYSLPGRNLRLTLVVDF